MIPDQGTLQETTPVRLLISLHESSQTGILYFRQNEILKVFYLNRGRISWAISSDETDRIDHVLLAKKLVLPEILAPYQAGNQIAETFGKILVENGVISLDTLIQATREQVRRIAFSVMRWSSGSFQMVPEAPPNRLVSLDLDIAVLVSEYVLGQMDVNIAWEELGSLSGELQHDSASDRERLYTLDAEQQEVLSRFSEPRRLEAVLLDFPAERKHRVLKVLYFLLLAGLLKKREPEKSSHIDFKELDSLFGQDLGGAPAEVDIEMPAIIDESAIQDIPAIGAPEADGEKRDEKPQPLLPELPDLLPDEPAKPPPAVRAQHPASAARPQPPLFLKPEKQKSRLLSIPSLTIMLVAAVVGGFLWFSGDNGRPDPRETAQARTPERARPDKAAKPGPARPAGGVTEPQAKPPAAAREEIPRPEPGPEAARPAGEIPTPAGQAPITRPDIEPAVDEAGARKAFAAGDFRAAAEIWRRVILDSRVTFSILLEMDCQKASVRGAYRQVTDKEGFFLLNRERGGRTCWLVLWGRFRTAAEAGLAMKLVPDYFLKQSNPPSVIELAPYLQ